MIYLARKKYEMDSKLVDYEDSPYESEEQYGVGNSSNLTVTLIILKEEIRSCKVDNDIIMQVQEKQAEVNAMTRATLDQPCT